MTYQTFYSPPRYRKYFKARPAQDANGVPVGHADVDAGFFPAGFDEFAKSAAGALSKMKIEEIIEQLDLVSGKFLDRGYDKRLRAVDAISKLTGFSGPAVERCIDLEFGSSRAPGMRAALKNEFGDYGALDGFVYDEKLKGSFRVVPNAPVFAVCSSNIPALPHLSIMRSFLTKNPLILKTSMAEPVFAPLYMEAFLESGLPLAECAIVLCYNRCEEGLTERLIAGSRTVIAYGGPAAAGYFSKKVAPPKKLIMHPHKLGFGIIGKDFTRDIAPGGLAALAKSVVFDTVTFEQRACLAPHIYFYDESGNVPAGDFAAALLREFEIAEKQVPPAVLSAEKSYARRVYLVSAAFSPAVKKVFSTGGLRSAVILAYPAEFFISPL
ncbi:MAG: hypothetical protein COT18_09515, partial [Elusimicrobia bacterium CG08_land_8_20_14_0_20_59_10]